MKARSRVTSDQIQLKELSAENAARQRIVSEARQYFFAHGIRGVTMDDLAKELGMSKKTLYAHFPGKAELVKEVILAKFRSVEADMDRITADCSAGFPDALHRLLESAQRHTREIQPPFLRDIRREPDLFKLIENRRRDVVQRYFGKLLAEGHRTGILREDIPTELVIEILLGAVQGIMNPQKLEELGLTPQAGFSAIITVILQGVVTQDGRSQL